MVQTKGIVLHKTKYGDTGLIIKIFTLQYGTLSFFVKNSFSKKSKFHHSFFSPLRFLDLQFKYKKESQLLYFKEITSYYHYQSIPFNIKKSSIFIFYNELIYKLLFSATKDEEIFTFLERKLIELDQIKEVRPDHHIIFMYELARILGFAPEEEFTHENLFFPDQKALFDINHHNTSMFLSKEAHFYFQEIIKNYEQPEKIQIAIKTIRKELLMWFIRFYQLHNEHIKSIESIDILTSILS